MRHPLTLTLALASVLAIAACTPMASSSPTGNPATTGPAATAGPAATSPATTGAAATSAAGTTVHVRDFAIDPSQVSVPAGTVALAVTNDGPTVHNLTVRDAGGEVLFGTPDLREGASESVSGELEPGEYVLFCSLPGHESLGMKGTLTVSQP